MHHHSPRWAGLASLLTVCLMMMAAAIAHSGRVFGVDLRGAARTDSVAAGAQAPTAGGEATVINTTELCADITGYAGPTPLAISVSGGVITDIQTLPNQETPAFFQRIRETGLLSRYLGLTPAQAETLRVDAATGATYSSRAVIAGVQRAMQTLQAEPQAQTKAQDVPWLTVPAAAALLVVLLGVALPRYVRSRTYRTRQAAAAAYRTYRIVQLLLNVAVVGLWCGTFISYTALLSFFENGLHLQGSLVLAALLVVGFVLPLAGRRGHYCAWICPLGSAQELAGRCLPWRLTLGPRTLRALTRLRSLLWAVLMVLMLTGVWYDWLDYEPFAAFLWQEASTAVLITGGVVLLLSLCVDRPYCRFVCPMGCLLSAAQGGGADKARQEAAHKLDSIL